MEPDREPTIYDEDGMNQAMDADEIDPEEEGFMQGYEEDEEVVKCALCKSILDSKEDTIELEIDGEIHRFCSNNCAEKFSKNQEE